MRRTMRLAKLWPALLELAPSLDAEGVEHISPGQRPGEDVPREARDPGRFRDSIRCGERGRQPPVLRKRTTDFTDKNG